MPRNTLTTEAINYLLLRISQGHKANVHMLLADSGKIPAAFSKPYRSLKNSVKINRLCEYMASQGLITGEFGNYKITRRGMDRIVPPTEQPDSFLHILLINYQKQKDLPRKRLIFQLKRLGFVKLQRGVWACRYDHEKAVNQMIDRFDIRSSCIYLKVDRDQLQPVVLPQELQT